MTILYYADSLGMPRPGSIDMNQRYIHLFQEWLKEQSDDEIFLFDRAKGAGTIKNLHELYKLDEGYFAGRRKMLVIHCGVVDCAPRPIPLYIRNIISGLPGFVKQRIIRLIHNNRARMLRSGFRFYQTSDKNFEKILEEWLHDASKKFSRIYVVNIAPTIETIEKHSPGFTKSIQRYNQIMQKVIGESGYQNVLLVDVYNNLLNSGFELEMLMEDDGHHITPLAHSLYSKELIRQEALHFKVNA